MALGCLLGGFVGEWWRAVLDTCPNSLHEIEADDAELRFGLCRGVEALGGWIHDDVVFCYNPIPEYLVTRL